MDRSKKEQAQDAINAGAMVYYPTAFGKGKLANPHRVIQRGGLFYFEFKTAKQTITRRVQSCLIPDGSEANDALAAIFALKRC